MFFALGAPAPHAGPCTQAMARVNEGQMALGDSQSDPTETEADIPSQPPDPLPPVEQSRAFAGPAVVS